MYVTDRDSALAAMNAFLPRAGGAYAGRRNYDLGPGRHTGVSGLSPWIQSRLLSEWEVVDAVVARQGAERASKFIDEVCWRTYWKGWLQLRPSVWDEYLESLTAARLEWAGATLYEGVLSGASGFECMDAWATELVETGYLHNHARMWFASIWVHTLKLPWVLGADFFLRHLLDGDAASNTLSWRWVAGLHTVGKTYLARADNIRKYTEGRFAVEESLATEPVIPAEGALPPAGVLPELGMPPSASGLRLGLLMHEGDLSVLRWMDLADSLEVCGGFFPSATYDSFGISKAVQSFRMESLRGALPKGAPLFEGIDAFVEWAREQKLEGLVLSEVHVGLWNVPFKSLRAALAEARIQVFQVRSEWDAHFHPRARAGFFRFKQAIPKALDSIIASS